MGKAIKDRIFHSATQKILDDEYPRFLHRKIERLDSMDFSPVTMLRDIKEALDREKTLKKQRKSSQGLNKVKSEMPDDH